jgi:SpoVK/Ycf46/Vps4 family AAA+-type ATPase
MVNYKFKDIKVFASTEWLANNEKNYRLVYDESELSYIYCELSFFNKLFDEDDWDLKIRLKCFGPDGKEICNLNCDRTVKKDDNIVYVREGWGVKTKGTYWKRGSYRWEAWVDGKYIAEKAFYLEQDGLADGEENPYFKLDDIKLYEGPDANVPEDERTYLKIFNATNTRYVWVEFEAENLITDYDFWACELIFNFRTESGQLKGTIDKLLFIYPGDESIKCTVGWGSDMKGTWYQDMYSVDIVFMNQIVATIPFQVGQEAVELEGDEKLYFQQARHSLPGASPEPQANNQNFEELMEEFNSLIGLEGIKKKLHEYTSYLNFIKIRRKKGFADVDKINLHAVFTGNPGTGKTTVAKMLGKLYNQLGLLSKGHVYEVDRSDLVAEYIGQTAPKAKEAIKKAKGGVLFIDEAYSLSRKDDDTKDFGKEVIEVLVKEMSDGDGDIAVVVAGYPEQMNNFLNSNPGLKSRFNMNFEFTDFKPDELMQIADYASKKRLISFDEEARVYLKKKLIESYRNRSETFGNARFVNTMLDEAKMNMGLRLMKENANPEELSQEELSTVKYDDLEKIFTTKKHDRADIPIDEELLTDSLAQLKLMVGLENVKKEIDELVKLVRFYREIRKDLHQSFSLHAVFTGNPGTGKTSVARILAQIYKSLGILERGHLIEVDRQALVGEHIGATAQKTRSMIDKAMGGVLFVDEAYSLLGGNNDFGHEAIETLLKRMEDDRDDFIVIMAGYTKEMQALLESNPGLKSRFDRVIDFADYNEVQLFEIALKQLADQNIYPEPDAKAQLKVMLDKIYATRDKYFGNGRSIRKVVEEAIKNQHLRLAAMPAEARTPELIRTLSIADVAQFDNVKHDANKGIGFKLGS